MWIGKFIAGMLGYAYAGFFGAVIGLFIGHIIDKQFSSLLNPLSAEQQREIERVFFATVFSLLGKMAKSDGRISEREIGHTEQLMSQMGLSAEHRREAIELFREGAKPEFSVDSVVERFNATCGNRLNLKTMLLNYLISLAIADGDLKASEEAVLQEIAAKLGFSGAMFGRLIDMIRAQSQFRSDQGHRPGAAAANELQTAYQALGVGPESSDSEIKKAYRRLMSENHPDKLMGQGLPEDMIKLATERSQEIRTAYDIIVKHRRG